MRVPESGPWERKAGCYTPAGPHWKNPLEYAIRKSERLLQKGM
ncbi:hypothetical protein QFZ76_004634 [Streptomyces sp. V4I2]|nr:hypothetical protein [Streptomyces sp. V4I2]